MYVSYKDKQLTNLSICRRWLCTAQSYIEYPATYDNLYETCTMVGLEICYEKHRPLSGGDKSDIVIATARW